MLQGGLLEMNEAQIVSLVNDYLHKAAKSLSRWLDDMLPRSGEDWWEECVLSNLSYNQREQVKVQNIQKLEDFDLAALLRITDKSWFVMRNYAYLPTSERETIRDMVMVRNDWAHVSA